MSKTDKDVPYRVRKLREGMIEHDHRSGECREATPAQTIEPTWRKHSHWRACKKYEVVATDCQGALLVSARVPRTPWGGIPCYRKDTCSGALESLAYLYEAYRDALANNDFSFYDEKAAHRFFTRYQGDKRHYCSRKHETRVFHADWPCTCDDDLPAATCEYSFPADGVVRWHSAPPRWFRNGFHRVERRNERDVLNDARRDYNANGDTDVEPGRVFHQHCAWWYWA